MKRINARRCKGFGGNLVVNPEAGRALRPAPNLGCYADIVFNQDGVQIQPYFATDSTPEHPALPVISEGHGMFWGPGLVGM